ncbi:alanine racemase [Ahrensia sp. 13_GOM-1096m]|uniref:alanine racemase n=1 Tax=Ahrensia sp. 13_GOM-1096m TaxID=1380380 RepID=UPI00047DFA32|nr:alanine racemase [Ahrensia sp. 13_GOM-1096m]
MMMTRAGAVLNVNLAAISANYQYLCKQAPTTKVAAVVKSNAYGLGAEEIATQLRSDKCDTFFVAHLEEGIKLRKALGRSPEIFILNGIPDNYADEFLANHLTPVINSLSDLELWIALAKQTGKSLTAALQFDTGMSRLGLSAKDIQKINADPSLIEGINIDLTMSHLACAGDPSNPANEQQRQAFDALCKTMPKTKRSLANSSGIFLSSEFHYDLARPGAALYGINPTGDSSNPMKPVVQLQARILEIRDAAVGTQVGYDYLYKASTPRRLATLSIGYADGWHRQWTSGAMYEGIYLPVVGRISMDSMVVDITDVPEAQLSRNMFVDLINTEQTLDKIADTQHTIGYEVLTSIGERVERRYSNK